MHPISLILAIGIQIILIKNSYSKVDITNVKCEVIDRDFTEFEYCYIKAINRTYKYMSLKVKLFQLPVTNFTVNVSLNQRLSGYKPFLYNITVDVCKFFKDKKNLLFKYFYGFIEHNSNINHTCPYNHDLLVEKMDVTVWENQFTKVLSMPDGSYGLFTKWMAYNIPRATVKIFVDVKN